MHYHACITVHRAKTVRLCRTDLSSIALTAYKHAPAPKHHARKGPHLLHGLATHTEHVTLSRLTLCTRSAFEFFRGTFLVVDPKLLVLSICMRTQIAALLPIASCNTAAIALKQHLRAGHSQSDSPRRQPTADQHIRVLSPKLFLVALASYHAPSNSRSKGIYSP